MAGIGFHVMWFLHADGGGVDIIVMRSILSMEDIPITNAWYGGIAGFSVDSGYGLEDWGQQVYSLKVTHARKVIRMLLQERSSRNANLEVIIHDILALVNNLYSVLFNYISRVADFAT